jgi:hypothetical protein
MFISQPPISHSTRKPVPVTVQGLDDDDDDNDEDEETILSRHRLRQQSPLATAYPFIFNSNNELIRSGDEEGDEFSFHSPFPSTLESFGLQDIQFSSIESKMSNVNDENKIPQLKNMYSSSPETDDLPVSLSFLLNDNLRSSSDSNDVVHDDEHDESTICIEFIDENRNIFDCVPTTTYGLSTFHRVFSALSPINDVADEVIERSLDGFENRTSLIASGHTVCTIKLAPTIKLSPTLVHFFATLISHTKT